MVHVSNVPVVQHVLVLTSRNLHVPKIRMSVCRDARVLATLPSTSAIYPRPWHEKGRAAEFTKPRKSGSVGSSCAACYAAGAPAVLAGASLSLSPDSNSELSSSELSDSASC